MPWIPNIEAKVAKGQQNLELDLICICHLGRLAKISQLWVTLIFRQNNNNNILTVTPPLLEWLLHLPVFLSFSNTRLYLSFSVVSLLQCSCCGVCAYCALAADSARVSPLFATATAAGTRRPQLT